jgi:hypothetical protein
LAAPDDFHQKLSSIEESCVRKTAIMNQHK